MTRRIFILEDDPLRMRQFYETFMAYDQYDIDHVESCVRVSRFQPPYDLICLNHDLGGRQLEDHEDNGVAFAKLIKDKINPEAHIVVHSYNASGAKEMLAVLREVPGLRGAPLYLPFGRTMLDLCKEWLEPKGKGYESTI